MMTSRKRFVIIIVGILIILGAVGVLLRSMIRQSVYRLTTPPVTPAPSPTTVHKYGRTLLHYPQDYTIALVGDSMTERLGNAEELRANLRKYYPGKSFEVLNSGYGATNILSVPDRLTKQTRGPDRDFGPIIGGDVDLIVVESMGNNPLSQFPLEQGLQVQTQTLDVITKLLQITNPDARIVFAATIAPNKDHYAEGKVDLSKQERARWASERSAYIENHLAYAQSHGIPAIDVYHESMDTSGNGNLDYIDKTDYIHPSPKGIRFISQTMADGIYGQHLLRP